MSDVNDFLFAGGAKAFPFEKMGDKVKGVIESAEVRQQTSIEGEKLTWSDGQPRMQLVIVLQTSLRDNGDDDDGKRTLYAKGGNFEVATGSGQSMRNAIAEAVKAAGGRSLDPGDELAVAFTGLGTQKRGYQAPKLYEAQFKKGTPSVAADDLFGD